MKALSILLLLSLSITTFGGRRNKPKHPQRINPSLTKHKSSDSKASSQTSNDDSSSSRGSSSKLPNAPSTTDYIPTNDELCDCYDIDLVCSPITSIDGEICYYYLITKTSDEDYCEPITSFTLGTDNDCGLTPEDIDELLLNYAPQCYDVDALSDHGIHVTIDPTPPSSDSDESSSSSSTKSSASSSKTDSKSNSYSGSPSDSSESSESGSDNHLTVDSQISQVSEFQESGQIKYGTHDGDSYTCEVDNTLPEFCGTPEPTIATTSDPDDETSTTNAPTSASPTSSAPTTADPTSASPTSARPTMTSPTTTDPTSSSPTTSSTTTASPTSAEPTMSPTDDTASPTGNTPSPTSDTPSPTSDTPSPTNDTPSPTGDTASPTGNTPSPTSNTPSPTSVTSSPTSAPTTAQPSTAPTYVECAGNDAYNVAFLLDESGSVDEAEWTIVKTFVDRVITFDLSPVSYLALYEYASLPGFDNFYPFNGPKSGEEANMIQAISNNGWTLAGRTETWDAVNRVLDDFYDYNQVIPNYWRPNILFLVTDGNPTDDAGNPNRPDFISLDYNTCPYIENRLRQQFPDNYVDIVILVIDPDSSIDTSKIECLDYFNNGIDIIQLESFTSAAFTDIELRIREKICTTNQVPPDEGFPPTGGEWVYPNNGTGLGPVPTAPGGGRDCSNDPGADNPCTTTIAP